ncbi:MAG: hypothetical protein V1792_01955 [Pseudomonadota bacterium]
MGKKDSLPQFVGRITSGLSSRELPLKTIAFVREQLPIWRDNPKLVNKESEPDLNADLCKFLDRQAREKFAMVQFFHEEPQGGHRAVDISVNAIESKLYSDALPFIVLECKRLPPPGRAREKEYVTGDKDTKGGGIQRFKLGLYARRVDVAGIIGYIQKQTAGHWHDQINDWICRVAQEGSGDSCVWSDDDKLGALEGDGATHTAYCTSTHVRAGQVKMTEIRIHHLWVLMRIKSGN